MGRENLSAMAKASISVHCLSQGEQRALASFIAGRLPAGQLHGELCRAREAAIARATAQPAAVHAAPVQSAPAFTAA